MIGIRFTVIGAYTGRVFAAGITTTDAVDWGEGYGITRAQLEQLEPGERVTSDDGTVGITILRLPDITI